MNKLFLTALLFLYGTQVIAQELHPNPYKVLTEGKIISHQINPEVFKEYGMPEGHGVVYVAFKGELFPCAITEYEYFCVLGLTPKVD